MPSGINRRYRQSRQMLLDVKKSVVRETKRIKRRASRTRDGVKDVARLLRAHAAVTRAVQAGAIQEALRRQMTLLRELREYEKERCDRYGVDVKDLKLALAQARQARQQYREETVSSQNSARLRAPQRRREPPPVSPPGGPLRLALLCSPFHVPQKIKK